MGQFEEIRDKVWDRYCKLCVNTAKIKRLEFEEQVLLEKLQRIKEKREAENVTPDGEVRRFLEEYLKSMGELADEDTTVDILWKKFPGGQANKFLVLNTEDLPLNVVYQVLDKPSYSSIFDILKAVQSTPGYEFASRRQIGRALERLMNAHRIHAVGARSERKYIALSRLQGASSE